MKKLSEFENEDGVVVVAKLLKPIASIVLKVKDFKDPEGMAPIDFVTLMLEKSPKDVMEIFAILSETPVAEYTCNAATILADTLTLAADKELMSLFGLRSQTPTSFGSVSEIAEDR